MVSRPLDPSIITITKTDSLPNWSCPEHDLSIVLGAVRSLFNEASAAQPFAARIDDDSVDPGVEGFRLP